MIFVCFDLETSGLSARSGGIIQLAAIRFDLETGETGRIDMLVNPGGPVGPGAQQLTGIDPARLRLAMSPAQAVRVLTEFCAGAELIGHGATTFDRSFIAAQAPALRSRPIFDTLPLSRLLLPGQPSYKLGALTQALGLSRFHRHPHQAASDVEATIALFRLLIERARRLPDAELGTLRQRYPAGSAMARFFTEVVAAPVRERGLRGGPRGAQADDVAASAPTSSSRPPTIPTQLQSAPQLIVVRGRLQPLAPVAIVS